MKKYIFILIAALLTCTVAIAQTDGSKRNKKKKQKTEKVVKKDDSRQNKSGKKQKTEKTVKKDTPPKSEPQQKKKYREEPRVSSSYTPEVRTYYANGVSFEMVEVRGGTFTMGATPEQGSDVKEWEKPTHQVTLSTYMIGKTEVTQALWEAVMGKSVSQIASENGTSTYGVGSNYPMYDISWDDCQTFIRKLNALTGKNFRMPTEAEWEFAARGGNNSRGYKYSGSNSLENVAWCVDSINWSTHPVATKAPNELGIYDMSGNVWEWCSDYFGDYSSSSQYNPTGPYSGSDRVLRGGCWPDGGRLCRVSVRIYDNPTETDYYNDFLGLRLALSGDNNPKPVTKAYTPKVETFYANGVFFEMVEVRGGTFTMGATSEQGSDAYDDEKPTHQVTLSSYYIGKTEVTQALWQAVMGKSVSQIASENGWSTYGVGSNYPMYYISYEDCQEFIRKLNALTGKNFRMPTEAEWEFAARGGNNSCGYKYSGSNTLSNVAWYWDNNNETTHPVGTKSPNELGIYDMSGNVYEWCSDWKGDYSSSSQYNPTGSNSGSYRVFRGGCWSSDAEYCRVSVRNCFYPASRYGALGLRLAL